MSNLKLAIVGVAEISAMYNVSKQAVSGWVVRNNDFPKPYATLAMGNVWLKKDVVQWASQKGKKRA